MCECSVVINFVFKQFHYEKAFHLLNPLTDRTGPTNSFFTTVFNSKFKNQLSGKIKTLKLFQLSQIPTFHKISESSSPT